MNRRILFAAAIIGAFLLAWWAGFSLYKKSGEKPVTITPVEQAAAPAPADIQEDQPAETMRSEPTRRAETMRYLGWELDEAAETPTACFNFSQTVQTNADVTLRDYVKIDPEISFSLQTSGSRLCLGGFSYENDYDVRLLSGLPSDKENITLEQEREAKITFGDKPAFVSFAGNGIILPRTQAQGLAIETVNVDVLEVEIHRVTERILSLHSPKAGESTLEGEYSYYYGDDFDHSVKIWSDEIPVDNKRNKQVTTVLPIQDIVGEFDPGAYIVKAKRKGEGDEYRRANAWRWIISTDMALTSYRGDDGLTVTIRSIDTARALKNVDVTLIAENNDVLGRARTDGYGRVAFDGALLKGKGQMRPSMIMAYGADGDYAVLDFSRTPLDLSNFDIGGRSIAGSIDVYAYTERGVYRPGETVHLTALMRDNEVYALADRPVTVKIRKPNGMEIASKRFEDAKRGGGIEWDYAIPDSAPRGSWRGEIHVDGAGLVKSFNFSVEDFVPQKVKLELSMDETPVEPGEIRDITLDAQFLYGAPGGGLEGEAEARIQIVQNPFPDFKGYFFGDRTSRYREQLIDMGGGITNDDGQLELALDLKNENVVSSYPLRALITAGVAEPGGRYVQESIRVPVRTQNVYLGMKPGFSGRYTSSKRPVVFEIAAVDKAGSGVDQKVRLKLVEEDYNYQWFRERGRWRYRRDVRDVDVSKQDISLKASEPFRWEERLPRGSYRIILETPDGELASYQFGVGWGGRQNGQEQAPDQITMGAPSQPQNPGDKFTLAVDAPYAGEGELVIANESVKFVQSVKIPEGESEITLPFDKSWGDSVYAMLTLYTPRDKQARPVPRRAVGISYIALDRSRQIMALNINSPEVIRPRGEHVFDVAVTGVPSGEKVWMNFAAVDEGILRLTKYSSPDASGYYFGKKALGVSITDDYARILNPNRGEPVSVRSGSDSLGGEGLTVVPTKTVALYSGAVLVKNGKARFAMDLPEFNGELRLMATAWSKSAVGSDAGSVKVRDKVPAIVGLPRFLAPGDQAMATVSLDNVEGETGQYLADFGSDGVVEAKDRLTFTLDRGERGQDKIALLATETGFSDLGLNVTGPAAYSAKATYPIQVRAPYMDETVTKTTALAPGTSLTLGPDLISDYFPLSTDVNISISPLAGMDPAPYIQSLARYPYGCTEQTVSSGMPLLYVDALGGFDDISDAERRRGIQKAVERLTSRQGLDGAFGLWSEGDRNAAPWLGIYATDFLQRAKEEGYDVSENVMNRAYKAASEITEMPRYSSLSYDFRYGFKRNDDDQKDAYFAEAAAYAHYVLARGGKGDLSAMRYHFDNHRSKMNSPLSFAYLGKALALMGDKPRSKKGFMEALEKGDYDNDFDYFQSQVRDRAGFVALAAGHLDGDTFGGLIEDLKRALGGKRYLNTQEKGHLVLAFKSLLQNAEEPSISVTGAELGGPKAKPTIALIGTEMTNDIILTNEGAEPIYVSSIINGFPRSYPDPVESGLQIEKVIYRMDGSVFEGGSVKQGETFVVALKFRSRARENRMVVIADLLPAGFEIESVLKPADGKQANGRSEGAYAWVGKVSSFDIAEARDDRFVASKRLWRWNRSDDEHAAYIVRAVTPGEFALPGALIEDMYRPQDMARTAIGKVTITADPTL